MSSESESQTDKSKKYDRQLRLWGERGQAALETASVCLINATAAGTETLKNLVLPGIGSFAIVDGEKVTKASIGNNFFLHDDWLGKSRAECATALLLELNGDVKGNYVDETAERMLQNRPEFFKSFSCVIATNLSEKTLLNLGDILWGYQIPLVVVRAYGMIGYIRLVFAEHPVVESHPESAHPDLRLDRPFPEFVQYVDSLDLTSMTKQEHGHTPFLVLLLKYLNRYKESHDGNLPKTYKEKGVLKELIKTGILLNENGDPEDEENFDEAVKNVNSCLVPTRVPEEVESVFADPACCNLTHQSSTFWILARAVKDFVANEGEGALPLRGSIPDMTADSKRYIKLQQIYQAKAMEHATCVKERVYRLLDEMGKPRDSIADEDVKLFCKNAHFLRVIRCRSLGEEYARETAKSQDIDMHLGDEDSDLVFYVVLRAADRFQSQENRYPGETVEDVDSDKRMLKETTASFVKEMGINSAIKTECIDEMCRYGGCELHAVAAFLGGVAAQEVIKIVTHQFVPFNNTFVYNAIRGTSLTIEL
ncbi:NEDD8-activating enzyme E1 regulatory subunit-like [Oscarella lobularis]|uniref:NEDD8-activating enzyme E1 regulatory subunit-like n=1 Tax=Oscarella lobularis TaxID=121494 RepID=UPI0033132541